MKTLSRASAIALALVLVCVSTAAGNDAGQLAPTTAASNGAQLPPATAAGDAAPVELEPEPEATPDLTLPSACRGFTTMGNKTLWDSGVVIDPVSKREVTIGNPINWRVNPTNSRSWPIYLHGMSWARGYVADYLKGGDVASLNRAIEIVRSHEANVTPGSRAYPRAWKDHPVSLRLTTLACIAAATSLPADLQQTINELADWQTRDENYFRRHNHGLMQNLSLIRAGCELKRSKWLNTAWARMKSDFDFAVNKSGVNNEQATGYAFFNWRAWAEALNEIKQCPWITVSQSTVRDFERRLQLLADFNMHATQPDGFMVPIGDTLVTRTGLLPTLPGGPEAEPETSETQPTDLTTPPKTAVYKDGYVFGRSSWQDPDAMHWSLRFGQKVAKHGHDDHLAVTHFVDGKPLLIDGAHAGYDRGSDRAYLISRAAHNTPTVIGNAKAAPRASQLVSSFVGEQRVVATVKDSKPTSKKRRETDRTPLRTRTVVADYPSRVLVTWDRAAGSTVRVPWTFRPDTQVASTLQGQVRADDTTLQFFDLRTCERPPVTQSQGRQALGWRQLVNVPRVIVEGSDVVSIVAPGQVEIVCTVTNSATTFTVTDEQGQTSVFSFDEANGLR